MKTNIKIMLITFFILGTALMIFGQQNEEKPLAEQRNYQFAQDSDKVNSIIKKNNQHTLEIGREIAELEEQGYIIRDYFISGICLSADTNYNAIEIKIYNTFYCFIVK
jgi:hypothetical protein